MRRAFPTANNNIHNWMNHDLKADNKGPGTFPRKRVLVLIWSKIPRSHVSLIVCGVVAVQICLQTGDGNGVCNRYLCLAFGVALRLGWGWFPWGIMETPSQHWHWITGIHTVIVTQIQIPGHLQILKHSHKYCSSIHTSFCQQFWKIVWFINDVLFDVLLHCGVSTPKFVLAEVVNT